MEGFAVSVSMYGPRLGAFYLVSISCHATIKDTSSEYTHSKTFQIVLNSSSTRHIWKPVATGHSQNPS